MVQFVKGGPDIPEDLLRDHEEGRVIFFCGAGVSRQACLPGFGKLVDQCYEELCTECTPEQCEAIKSKEYADALGLLEEALGPKHLDVCRTITKILNKCQEQHKLDTHRALLKLAQYQNRTRLITTNFDHLFEKAAIDSHKIDYCDPATLLLGGVHTWNGVVYLHGRMPELSTLGEDKSHDHQLACLVLTGSDFARAYLMGNHITDFIQRIFLLRYTICFVGYSLDDIMFQYLLDGNRTLPNHSADQDPFLPKLYAFVGAEGTPSKPQDEKPQDEKPQDAWKRLGVTRIRYDYKKPKDDAEGDAEDHTSLHKTLCRWAESTDVKGKTKIIEDSVCGESSDSASKDSFVGRRVRWALKDVSGEPAECFATLRPVPPLEWLELSEDRTDIENDWDRYREGYLVKPNEGSDTQSQVRVSLFHGLNICRHKAVITELSYWLAHHLNDPRVLVWLIRQEKLLRQEITSCIQRHLRLQDVSSNPLPKLKPKAQQYWHLFLGRHVLCELPRDCAEFLDWQESLVKNGLTKASKAHLLRLFEPMLVLKLKPQLKPLDSALPKSSIKGFDDVICELSYVVDHRIGVPYWLKNPQDGDNWHSAWQEALPELFSDFNGLLRDGLDLLRLAGCADNKRDGSCAARFSISDHERDNNDSGGLLSNALGLYITLVRNAWLAKHNQHPKLSKADATQWMQEPYPVFKRLAFFAATQSTSIKPQQALKWLLADDGIWLWSGETRREAIQLIVYLASLASKPNTADIGRLEQAILAKPPQLHHWDIGDWDVYLRLVRLKKHLPKGIYLGGDALARLEELHRENPKWGDDPDEDEEFPSKFSIRSMGEPGDGRKYYDIDPNRRSWVQWIQEHPSLNFQEEEDGWAKFCNTHFPVAVCVLYALAKDDLWPETRWCDALDAWVSSEHSKRIHRSWRRISPLLETASDDLLLSLDTSLGAWILKATRRSAIAPRDEILLIQLSKRLLELPVIKPSNIVTTGKESVPNYVSQSLNSRIGRISEALLIYWYKKQPEDNARLPVVFESLFTRMCDVEQEPFRCARVALARYILPLFRVDPEWTRKYLLPLFNWGRDTKPRSEACAVWQVCLTAGIPVLNLPKVIRPHFLTTAKHDSVLGHETAERYCVQLINTVISAQSIFTDRKCKQAIASLSPEGRVAIVSALTEYLRASKGQDKVKKWGNTVARFFERVWPREVRYQSSEIARQMEECCDCAGERSKQARELLAPYIQPYIRVITDKI